MLDFIKSIFENFTLYKKEVNNTYNIYLDKKNELSEEILGPNIQKATNLESSENTYTFFHTSTIAYAWDFLHFVVLSNDEEFAKKAIEETLNIINAQAYVLRPNNGENQFKNPLEWLKKKETNNLQSFLNKVLQKQSGITLIIEPKNSSLKHTPPNLP